MFLLSMHNICLGYLEACSVKHFRSLSDTRQRSETDEINHLRESLSETEEQARSSKRNEQLLSAERNQLEEELGAKKKDNEHLQSKLDQKVEWSPLKTLVF